MPGSSTRSPRCRPSSSCPSPARPIRFDQLEPRREESKRLGGLLEHLTAEKSTLQTRSSQAEAAAGQLFESELAEIAATDKTEARRDILTQTLALHALFQAGNRGGQFAYYTYMILTQLFMLVDTIPLIVKFSPSPAPMIPARTASFLTRWWKWKSPSPRK